MKSTTYGEGAVYLDLDIALESVSNRAARTLAAAAALRGAFPDADIVAGAGVVVAVGIADPEAACAAVEKTLGREVPSLEGARIHEIATIYDGPDLDDAAATLGIAPDALVAMHAGREYTAELTGFLPGFSYLGPLDPRLVLPRRASPRPAVAAGSVGIAGTFTGIYPLRSPGGWILIGRAVHFVPFDPGRDPAMLIQPGDRVRFVPTAHAEDDGAKTEAPHGTTPGSGGAGNSPSTGAAIEVLAAPACVTVQDLGRTGQLGKGIPPSGPLDPDALLAANKAVGNGPGAAAIEVPLGGLRARARGEILASIDGEEARRFKDGEEIRVEAGARAVRYLAARGGIAVPEVLGARATLLVARLGGFQGRPLRRGDVVPIAPDTDCSSPEAAVLAPEPPGPAVLEVDPGPHIDRFPDGALRALLDASWQVSHLADRVGVRLEGGRVPRDRPDLALPVPMIRGAVQIATDGTPIVLGPDHPVTGGYPVLVVVRRASQARLARLRAGAEVRLRLPP